MNSIVYTDYITPHFTFEEILPPNVKWEDLTDKERHELQFTANLAESVRAEAGYPCYANTYSFGGDKTLRGFRLFKQQLKLFQDGLTTALEGSRHPKGKAIDLVCPNMDIFKFAEVAKKYFNTVIVYPKKGFIHCDTDLREGKKYYSVN